MAELIIGTAQFGLDYGVTNHSGEVELDGVRAILMLAKCLGIRSIDTARAYGDCERKLGAVGVEGFEIISKLSISDPKSSIPIQDQIEMQLDNTFSDLRISRLAGMLIHNPSAFAPAILGEAVEFLGSYRAAGLVGSVGVSLNRVSDIDNINLRNVDILQFPLNILDRRFFDIITYVNQNFPFIKLHVRSIFLQGLLLEPLASIPSYFRNHWGGVFKRLDNITSELGFSRLEASLSFIKSFADDVDVIIVGVTSLEQLQVINDTFERVTLNRIAFDRMIVDDEQLISPSSWPRKW